MSEAAEAFDQLLAQQQAAERGPRREGAFALWLLARVAHDLGTAGEELDRAGRRRLVLLERRLAPLALPRPLARGLTTALAHMQEGTPAAARIALSQLVAPARESLGSDAGEAVARLVKDVHDRQRSRVRDEE